MVGALAMGLCQAAPSEFECAASKVLPLLSERGLLPTPSPLPASAADASRVCGAHAILLAMRTHQLLSENEQQHEQQERQEQKETRRAHLAERARLATGFAKWLGQAAHDASAPLSVAHLLGVAARAASLCAGAEKQRFLVLRLALQQRLSALLKAKNASADADAVSAPTSSMAGPLDERTWDALSRALSVGTRDQGSAFMPIDSL